MKNDSSRPEKKETIYNHKIEVISRVVLQKLPHETAANQLGITTRQVRRLVKIYKEEGPMGLLHKGLGRAPGNKLPDELKNRVLDLVKERFLDTGPQLISDELQDLYEIDVNSETLRRWMTEEGLWSPQKAKAVHRRKRDRRPCKGELVQMDTSEHHWVVGSNEMWRLIAMIDDATSTLYCRFYEADSTETNMDCIVRYIEVYGRPGALYTDRAGHFRVNLTAPKETLDPLAPDKRPVTQIERALKECDIGIIHALSPEAKGRVERAFDTCQDRIPKQLKVRNITTIEEANKFLEAKFMPWWNTKLVVAPTIPTDAHMPVSGLDLKAIFSEQLTRVVQRDFTFRFDGEKYQIVSSELNAKLPKARIRIERRLDGTMKVRLGVYYLKFYKI